MPGECPVSVRRVSGECPMWVAQPIDLEQLTKPAWEPSGTAPDFVNSLSEMRNPRFYRMLGGRMPGRLAPRPALVVQRQRHQKEGLSWMGLGAIVAATRLEQESENQYFDRTQDPGEPGTVTRREL